MEHFTFRHALVHTIFLLLQTFLYGNNIQITNVSLTGQNTTDHFTLVKFDISWENSWRLATGPANWDAAWVFVKYRIGAGPWLHAWINNTGHTSPSGSSIDAGLLDPASAFDPMTNPGIGAFIHRSDPGSGTFSLTDIQLQWNYGDNGVFDNQQVDIKVFAIEQVYIPQGEYYLGSGGSESGAFYIVDPGGSASPYLVNSEDEITIANSLDDLYYQNTTGTSGDQSGPLPAQFPKGFIAYYVMKYELSQQGYVDFLNTLTRDQQLANINASFPGNSFVLANSTAPAARSGIRIIPNFSYSGPEAPGVFYCDLNNNTIPDDANDGKNVPCNFIKWSQIAAYLDWAGLRPLTELEFEKAGRGTLAPVPDEYAWGSKYAVVIDSFMNYGKGDEGALNPLANINCESPPPVNIGPVRCGAFAKQNIDRVLSGAGFYGVMELSGNLGEIVVSAGSADGRSFDDNHGDGLLPSNGQANVSTWPSSATAVGMGERGGYYFSTIQTTRLSDRSTGAFMNSFQTSHYGIRGARTSPN